MHPETLQFRPYNNNASELCHPHSFVLFTEGGNGPKEADVVAFLGQPTKVERHPLARSKNAVVYFYPPSLLEERLIRPAKAWVKQRFPAFECPGSNRTAQETSVAPSTRRRQAPMAPAASTSAKAPAAALS